MILSRYLIREFLQAFIATLAVLLLIIVGNTVASLLTNISDGQLPTEALGILVIFGSIEGAIQLAPIALLVGMMMALGRFYRDNEISAMHASGIGPEQFFKAIFLLMAPLTLLLATLVLYTMPQIQTSRQEITNELKQRPEASGIPVGEFMHIQNGKQKFTIFVESHDEKNVVMNNFFLNVEDNTDSRTMLASNAVLFIDKKSGDRMLQVNKGSRYDQNKKDSRFSIFKFREHGIRVPSLTSTTNLKLGARPTLTLIGSNDVNDTAELHWRFGIILSAPIMALLAFPLSYATPRQGRFGKLAIGILIYALYANLLITGKALLEDGKTPPVFGLWWVHLPFIILSVVLIWRRYGGLR